MNWITPSFSGPVGNCYEVARPEPDLVLLRNSRLGESSPVHPFSLEGWYEVIQAVQGLDGDGALSIGVYGMKIGAPEEFGETVVERVQYDRFVWNSTQDPDQPPLEFTLAEHDAFLMAVGNEELTPEEYGGRLKSGDTRVNEYPDPVS